MDRMLDGAPSPPARRASSRTRYYMRSVAADVARRPDGGTALAALGRRGRVESGSPTALAQADYARALSFENHRSRRALGAPRSQRAARRVGREPLDPRVRAHREPLDPRQVGPRSTRSRATATSIDTWFRGGDWANQWLSLRHVFAILESLGRDEAAATLHGALDAVGRDADAARRAVERRRVRTRGCALVGAVRPRHVFADAVERGRTLRDEELVRAVLQEIDSI